MKLRLKKFSFHLQTAQLSWDKRGIFLPYQHMLPFRMATSFEKQFNTYIEVRMVAKKTTLPTSMPRSLGKRKLHKVKICEVSLINANLQLDFLFSSIQVTFLNHIIE